MKNDIVPFGKYKGQPIEVLANDRQYCEWLMGQGDFLNRYSGIKTLIINNFKEPEDTPEHNKLQALFLDNSFCLAVFKSIGFSIEKISSSVHERDMHHQKIFKKYNDVIQKDLRKALMLCDELKAFNFNITQVKFEVDGADVFVRGSISNTKDYQEIYEKLDKESYSFGDDCISSIGNLIRYHFHVPELKIEIKPTIGDDYPSVMRQIKANKCNVLFYQSYSGAGISEQDMIKMFNMSKIYTSKLSEVESLKC
jgi:hypothetical protein